MQTHHFSFGMAHPGPRNNPLHNTVPAIRTIWLEFSWFCGPLFIVCLHLLGLLYRLGHCLKTSARSDMMYKTQLFFDIRFPFNYNFLFLLCYWYWCSFFCLKCVNLCFADRLTEKFFEYHFWKGFLMVLFLHPRQQLPFLGVRWGNW